MFFTVNSSVNAACDHLADGSVMEKALRFKKTFPQGYVISLCGVVVRCSRVEPNVPGSSVGNSFFLPFFVFLFSINIYLNNRYLIKCN